MSVVTNQSVVVQNVDMKSVTSFCIGGLAKKVYYPSSIEEVIETVHEAENLCLIGGGSNLLVADGGIDQAVMIIGKRLSELSFYEIENGLGMVAQAGANLTRLGRKIEKKSLKGFEFLCGIPGNLGGAIRMNAGAYGGEIADILKNITIVNRDGEMIELENDQCGFGYRTSHLPEGSVIVSARFELSYGDPAEIGQKMKENLLARSKSQPLEFPSAGSVYKNPEGDYAGRLIEQAGLKGARVGTAEVSDKHANFIINRGGATASDVYRLMRKIEKEVFEQFGIRLLREIRLLGEFE